MFTDSYILLAIGLLLIVVLAAAVVIPQIFNKDKKAIKAQMSQFMTEFNGIFSTSDHETMQLKLQKFVSRFDNFIGKVLSYYGCVDPSVNRQIRMAMEKKLYSYEEFKVVKSFHLMRNQVIHEDKSISQHDVDTISHVLGIIQRLIG